MTEALERVYNYKPEFTVINEGSPFERRAEIDWSHVLICLGCEKLEAYKTYDFEPYYTVLSMVTNDMSYCLCWGELMDLARLHPEDFCRDIIEDILEDINFHTDCEKLRDGKYIEVYAECDKAVGLTDEK